MSRQGADAIAALDLTPVEQAAPWHRRVMAQAGLEARTTLRNGEHLLLSLVLPLLALIALARTPLLPVDDADRVSTATAGVLALALVSTAFTGRAIGTGFDRRHGVLRFLATTPLGPSGLVGATVLAVLAVQVVQLIVIGGTGLALGWRPPLTGLAPALVLAVLATITCVACALLLAGALRAEAVLAAANLVWVLLAAGGGLLTPTASLPGPLAEVAPWVFTGALGDGLRAALVVGRADLGGVAVLAVWAAVTTAAAARWFRWS